MRVQRDKTNATALPADSVYQSTNHNRVSRPSQSGSVGSVSSCSHEPWHQNQRSSKGWTWTPQQDDCNEEGWQGWQAKGFERSSPYKAPHGEDQLCAFCTLQAVGFPWSESTPGISFGDWSDKIYVKQVFGAEANWVRVGMPHLRAMEVRILFSGRETVFGFPYDDISGSNAKENCGLRVLQPMTWERLHAAASA